MMVAPAEDDEWRKAITATLMTGTPIVVYDNVIRPIESAGLAMALTATAWKDRFLGESKIVTLPQRATWIATGNNIRVGGDMPRRCYRIRLDSRTSQPWKRSGVRHENLLDWVQDNRGELLAAVLTLAVSWHAAGKPKGAVPRMGGFEQWAGTVGSVLAHAKVRGFLTDLEELYDLVDETTPQWESFLHAVLDYFGGKSFTVAQLVEQIQVDERLRQRLPEELALAYGDKFGTATTFNVKLGAAFRSQVETRYGTEGLHLARAGKEPRSGCIRWQVVAGMEGSQGLNLLTPVRLESEYIYSEGAGIPLQTLQPCKSEADDHDNHTPAPAIPSGLVEGTAPTRPCFACKSMDWVVLPTGGYVCGVCHPIG